MLAYSIAHAEVIDRINIEGVSVLPQEAVDHYISVSVGQDVDSQDIKNQIQQLYSSGYFSQVEIKLQDHVLTIILTEDAVVGDVSVEAEFVSAESVEKELASIGVLKGELINERALEEWRIAKQTGLRGSGFEHAVIKIDREVLSEGVVSLKIHLDEGDAIKLKAVEFSGDFNLANRDLQRIIRSGTTGLLSFIMYDDLYNPYMIEQDRLRLVDFYKAKGYRAPKVTFRVVDVTPTQRIWRSTYKKVIFDIVPGPKFTISEVDFVNDQAPWPEVLKARILEKLIGASYTVNIHQALRHEVIDFFSDDKHAGFYKVLVDDVIVGADTSKLTVTLDKSVAKTRMIFFRGNRSTEDEPLRRVLKVGEAQVFDKSMLRQSEQSLKNLPYIKDVAISTVEVEEGVYDVFVNIEELPSTFGGELGAEFVGGISAKASLSETNLLGYGHSLSAKASVGSKKRDLAFEYLIPNITLSGHSLGFSATYSKMDKENKETLTYHSDAFGLGAAYTMPISRHLRANTILGYKMNKYYEVDKASSLVRKFFENRDSDDVTQVKTGFGVTYRDIDSAYLPTKGIVADAHVGVALPFGDAVTYYDVEGSVTGYYPLGEMFEQPFVLRGRLMAKYVNDYKNEGADVPFFARYFAGGLGSVRGYGQLGPKYIDTTYEIDEETKKQTKNIYSKVERSKGGDKLFVANLEVQTPSPFPDLVRTYVYVDVGNVFEEGQSISLSELRGSAGVSGTIALPMGDFTVSLGIPFNKESSEEFKSFSLSPGRMF
nr:outer membrane protein assembly factor BamA [Candidatus Synchoanobacter obligatus]